MSIRKAIRQIQELRPGAYAIVFEHRLEAKELNELKELCQKLNIKALLLTDARVVSLDQLFALVAKVDEAEIQKALNAKPEVELDVTETQPNG
jgi:DNA-binding MurR/RpiR family transcriptional regulator